MSEFSFKYSGKFTLEIFNYFGLVDTAASVLPILNKHFFSIHIEPWSEKNPNELSFTDLFIWEILKDIDASQDINSTGKNDNTYADKFEYLLGMRSQIQKFKNWTPDFMQKAFHWITERIKVLFSFAQYFLIKSIASILNDAQVLLDKDLSLMEAGVFSVGIDPSHSQIAKDDIHHPLHELSALLAIKAVEDIGEKMMLVWEGKGSMSAVYKELDRIVRHPVECTWQDEIIEDWLKKSGNRQKVCNASSPSIMIDSVFHSLEHIEESLHNMSNMLVHSDMLDKVIGFFETELEAKRDTKLLKDGIQKAMNKSREQTLRVRMLKQKWDGKFAKPSNCN